MPMGVIIEAVAVLWDAVRSGVPRWGEGCPGNPLDAIQHADLVDDAESQEVVQEERGLARLLEMLHTRHVHIP
jgi:hypothetical protein